MDYYTKEAEKVLPDGTKLVVNVRHDDMCESPLEYEDTVHIECLHHRRYALGHEQLDEEEMEELRQRLLAGEMAAYLPVYMLDHSGVYLSTEPFGCKWDLGLIGWAYITKEKAQELQVPEEPGARTKFLNDCIRGVVKDYGHYVNGDCWVVRTYRGEDGDELDGVCVLGDLFEAEKEADKLLEECFERETERQLENRKYRLEPECGAFRLYALKDIPEHGVKAGDKGGVIAFDEQLSHEGACWVAEGAQLCNDAQVFDDALISGTVKLNSGERVGGNGRVDSNRHIVTITATAPEPISVCVYPNKDQLLATVNGYTDTVAQWKHKSADPVGIAMIVAAEKLLEEMNE